ncbi:hypothetical protein [Actinomadura violacea]|uniref:Uncharacterized protein n=1 Tax=Actinomadura violacea TaxID=2819934 RepID=A0ABS3RNI1_9ACTN|nr:hypothetical protein [Actinomadura violacea]MBO2458222.1 hypothetical protein [Actinomadura violacea]
MVVGARTTTAVVALNQPALRDRRTTSSRSRLRDEGVIEAWGLGVNHTEPIEMTLALDEPRPNGFLLAGRYTLLDHAHALQRLLPMAAEQGVDMIVGGPCSSGVLADGTHFEYADAFPEIIEKVRRLREIADRPGGSIKAAALQCCASPASSAPRRHFRKASEDASGG